MDREQQSQLQPGFYWVRVHGDEWEVCQIVKSGDKMFLLSTGDDESYFFPIDGMDIVGPLTPPSNSWTEV